MEQIGLRITKTIFERKSEFSTALIFSRRNRSDKADVSKGERGGKIFSIEKKNFFPCPLVKTVLSFIALASSFTIEAYERKELS
jgi:hypothetical protein